MSMGSECGIPTTTGDFRAPASLRWRRRDSQWMDPACALGGSQRDFRVFRHVCRAPGPCRREHGAKRDAAFAACFAAAPRRQRLITFLAKMSSDDTKLCQNIIMARGWESKDVESQVELLEAKQEKSTSAAKTAEQLRRDQERKDLQLSRVRIANDLESATHPQHRKSLEAALAHLDKKINEVS